MIEKSGKIALLVFIGFSISLLLTIILISYGLYKLDESNRNIHQIVTEHNSKEHLVSTMHQAARERVLSLFTMVAIDDPFDRDEWGIDTFYRFNLVERVELSFGYQVIFDPSFNPNTDSVNVFSLRLSQFF